MVMLNRFQGPEQQKQPEKSSTNRLGGMMVYFSFAFLHLFSFLTCLLQVWAFQLWTFWVSLFLCTSCLLWFYSMILFFFDAASTLQNQTKFQEIFRKPSTAAIHLVLLHPPQRAQRGLQLPWNSLPLVLMRYLRLQLTPAVLWRDLRASILLKSQKHIFLLTGKKRTYTEDLWHAWMNSNGVIPTWELAITKES